ncbi:hypothetical protein [Archaeoglobus veneficus]|uniref:Uncharacterized protein n=1 Tax=Archaeoglobus veneficus (strain DSM 11195 / SNP6) TaxID=693661 RepID=F2KNN9_ARCVS|nr:hypothetical protein [Archaeoglobus veneficus]AEA46267.1 hypothetical protein Arcve_0230 [Archaeoglobus veneficus SNP6]
MARRMETRSARFLAFFLALIMLGSVLVYALKGSYVAPERETKYDFQSFDDLLKCLPAGAGQIIYASTKNCSNEILLEYVDHIIKINYDPYVFSNLRLAHPVERMLVASYGDGLLYLVDVNKTKIYFAGEKDEYRGFKVKVANGIMVAPEVSPFLIGTAPHVARAIDTIVSGNGSMDELIANYTSRIPGSFNVILMFYGDAAKALTEGDSNVTDYMDFYFTGLRMNGSMYEKVVGVHFIKNGAFVDSNVTEYYNYTNYDDGLSVAVMRDTNFTKIRTAQPELRVLEIRLAN